MCFIISWVSLSQGTLLADPCVGGGTVGHHGETFYECHLLCRALFCTVQGEGPPVCYDVKYMDCTVHGTGASKFPLLQQENLTFELLRAVKHISSDYKILILVTKDI